MERGGRRSGNRPRKRVRNREGNKEMNAPKQTYHLRIPTSQSGLYVYEHWTADELQTNVTSNGDAGIEVLIIGSDGVNVTEKWVKVRDLSTV